MSALEAEIARDAPDPGDAQRRLARYLLAAQEAGIATDSLTSTEIGILRSACQSAPYLATLLIRDPARLGRVARDPHLGREKSRERLGEEISAVTATIAAGDVAAFHLALRRFRADEMLRLGARELGFGRRREVGRELAHLADVAFDAAIAFFTAELTARFGPPRYTDDDGVERAAELAVIAMGKHGGQELNFSSDVDVIYVYSSDAGSAGELSLHEYFSKLCRKVTQALAEVTDEDMVFRVDLRLRPEGSKGPIANSLASTEHYYESWGRPWERQAWLKGRAAAGSIALGELLIEILRPFIYPRITSPTVLDDVADLNRRIKVELDGDSIEQGFNVKNGVGGIREIEFFVQALQLVHAGRRPELRGRATMVALDQLLFGGLITDEEQRQLAAAYRFLRHVEHVLQLESGRQTQRLPAGDPELSVIARRVGLADAAAFKRLLDEHTAHVATLFKTLGDPGEQDPRIDALLRGQLEEHAEAATLVALGFQDGDAAAHVFDIARRKPSSPLGPTARGAAARVAPALIAEIAACPDPDQALRYVCDLVSRRGASSSLWRLFEESPSLLRTVISLFGTSTYLGNAFVNQPELIDQLVQSGRSTSRRTRANLEAQVDSDLQAAQQASNRADADENEATPDEEATWNGLAKFKLSEVLRIGLADISGELLAADVCTELSTVADVCITRAFALVNEAMQRSRGVPRTEDGREASLAVLALGKFGGSELGYASDLDIIFVYAGEGETDGARPLDNLTFMTRLAQRLLGGLGARHPGGRLWEVDTRLRPSGSKGLLVSSLGGWRAYHESSAALWERQALTKLRFVAGDPILGAEVEATARTHVYRDGQLPRELAVEIDTMRERMVSELGGGGSDVKIDRGGLIDCEFAAQFLQLAYGHDHSRLVTPSTLSVLEAAQESALAPPQALDALMGGYRFLRSLEHRMRIVHDKPVHRLPPPGDELEKLARRAAYPSGEALMANFERWAVQIREAYVQVLGLDEIRRR